MWCRISAWTPVVADTNASIFGSIGAISDTGVGIGTTLLSVRRSHFKRHYDHLIFGQNLKFETFELSGVNN